MSIRWTNNAASVLASDITAGTLSITVTTGHGDRFPEVVAPHYFMATLVDTSGNREIVKVTARTSGSNTMTIERAQEGTSARSFATGDIVELRITKNAMDHLSKAADINAQHYVCDASAADQGAATNSSSLKSLVDALGATEEATIDLPHTGTGDTTTYTVGTNLTIPATVTLRVHKGARVSPSGGVTLTVNGIIQAGAYTIFAGAGTVTVSTYPQDQAWWGNAQRMDGNFLVPAASESVAGLAELATQAEVDAGTDDARIVTPKKLYETYGLFRKNILINGGFSVAQRGTLSIKTSLYYGACDRWLMFFNSSGGTGSGSYVTGYSNLQSGIAIAGTSLASTNANSYAIGQRIEAKDSAAVRAALAAGKKLSFQCKIYHDIGSARDVHIRISTANAADNFSSVTARYTSGNISCASGSWTTVKYEGFSPTNTDFDKGFVLYIMLSTPAIMSGKLVYIGDAQLEIGERCTEVEVRPYATELDLCQRYYLASVCGFRHYNSAGGNVYFGHTVNYPTTMRSTPTITVTAGTRALVSGVSVVNQGRSGHVLSYYMSANGNCYAYDSFTANADL